MAEFTEQTLITDMSTSELYHYMHKVHKVSISVRKTDTDTIFRYPNGYSMSLPTKNVKEDADHFYLLHLTEEQANETSGLIATKGVVDKLDKGKTQISFVENTPMTKRSTIYSNHKNFVPSKRLITTITPKLLKFLESSDLMHGLDGETRGPILVKENFILIPMNLISFRFSKEQFTTRSVTPALYHRLLASVSQQDMDLQQFAQTVVILTRVQMTYLTSPTELQSLLSLFTILIDNNIMVLAKQRDHISWSNMDVWDEIMKHQVLIPTRAIAYETIPELMKQTTKYTSLGQFSLEPVLLKELAIKTHKSIDLNTMTKEEIRLAYQSGLLHVFTPEVKVLRIKTDLLNSFVKDQSTYESSEEEKITKFLVDKRMVEPNLIEAFNATVKFMEENISIGIMRKVVAKMAQFRIDSFYNPSLNVLYMKKNVILPDFDSQLRYQRVDFVNTHLETEKRLAQIAQTEFLLFSKILGIPKTNNVYNNFEFIFEVAKKRRLNIRPISDVEDSDTECSDTETEPRPPPKRAPSFQQDTDSEEEEESTPEEEKKRGFFSKLKSAVTAPYTMFSNVCGNVSNAASELTDFTTKMNQTLGEFNKKLENTGMKASSAAYLNSDFTRVDSTFASVKMMINAWFNDLVTKICELIGVTHTPKIDASLLLFYYLVWKSNDCQVIRFMIVADVLAQIGLLDFAMNIFRGTYSALKKLISEPATINDEFDRKLEELSNGIVSGRKKNLKVIKAVNDKINEQHEELEGGWIDFILENLKYGAPLAVGVTATVLLSAFGVKSAMDKKSLGSEIIQGARNVSFLALGLTAVPKIFEVIMKIVNYCVDHVKAIFISDHQTEHTICLEVAEFLKRADYHEGISEKIFCRCITTNLHFLSHYKQGLELEKKIMKIEPPALKLEFKQKMSLMKKLYPIHNSAMRLLVGQREIFHVQNYSAMAGVGKTDVSKQVFAVVQNAFDIEENYINKALGEKLNEPRSMLSDVYPMNDQLNHEDMYYGQAYGYLDEESVFTEPDKDTLIGKMTLLSGQAKISNQAALNDKGRILELKVLVSNTNNPFVEFKGMITPSALWRRRCLFKVEVKEEFLTQGEAGQPPTINDEAIIKAGINRTKGEHLLFTYVSSVDPKITPIDKAYVNMSVTQYKKLLVVLAKKHFIREEGRLQVNPVVSVIRNKFEVLRSTYEKLFEKNLPQADTPEHVQKIIDVLKGVNVTHEGRAVLRDFERTAQYTCDETDDAAIHFNTPEPISLIKFQGSVSKVCLVVKKHKGKEYYVLGHSDSSSRSYNGKIDFTRFKTIRVGDDSIVAYEPAESHSKELNPIILHHLMDFSACDSPREFKLRQQIAIKKAAGMTKSEEWKATFSMLHYNTLRVVKSTSQWIMDNVVQRIGEGVLNGFCIAFAVLASFFVLGTIGSLLAPTPISYNRVHDKKGLLNTPVTINDMHTNWEGEINIAKAATYKAYYAINGRSRSGILLGIKGSLFLGNRHFLEAITEKVKMHIYDHKFGAINLDDSMKEIEVGPKDIKYQPGCDSAMVHLRGFRPVRAVLKHFVTESDCEDSMINFKYVPTIALLLRDDENAFVKSGFKVKRTWHSTGWVDSYPCDYNKMVVNHPHDRVMRVNIQYKTVPGDSGSIAIHENNKIQGKFLGHILSHQDGMNTVYIGVVTQEMLQKMASQFPHESQIETICKEGILLEEGHVLKNVFKYNDEVYKSPLPNQGISRESGFKKSPVHGVFPVTTSPAIQRITDERIPPGSRHFLENALNKSNGTYEVYISQDDEKWMKNHLKNTYIKYTPGISHTRMYSTAQSITGIRSKGSSAMNTNSSPGLLYKLEPGLSGKKNLIAFNESTRSYNISERVFHDVEMYEQIYLSGKIPHNWKGEFPKKELVGPHKISEPRARTIGMGNAIHQVVYGKLFKDLHTNVKNVWDAGKAGPFALGIDPERHWSQVAKHLRYHDYMVDFDVKGWEEKVSTRFLTMAADVKVDLIEMAYASRGEKCPNIRPIAHGLAIDFMDTEVVFEDVFYRKRAGLLSGHPGTFMENTEIHHMIVGLAVKKILEKTHPAWATSDFILEHVRTIKAADDIVIAVSPLARRIVTVEALVSSYAELGFEVTAADKSKNIVAKNITEIQFLKTHFKPCADGFTPQPNLSIIHQLFNWIRDDTKLSSQKQFQINLENAFRFAFWRGEEEYEEIRKTANEHLIKMNMCWNINYEGMAQVVGQEMTNRVATYRSCNPSAVAELEDSLTHETI